MVEPRSCGTAYGGDGTEALGSAGIVDGAVTIVCAAEPL